MLKLYVSTVIIYSIVLWASGRITKPFVYQNGWLNTPRLDDGGDNFTSLFIMAIVPVFRLAVLIGIWYMAFNKKQH